MNLQSPPNCKVTSQMRTEAEAPDVDLLNTAVYELDEELEDVLGYQVIES